jgi:prepilin-type N-terminal cleavage/methylation domain-containing protein
MHKNIDAQKGFTLMELLIVIAIIGIFSAVILASLDQSRTNAANASIKENLITIRSQAAIYFDTNASYGAGALLCTTNNSLFRDPTITSALLSIAQANGGISPTCKSSSTSWLVLAQLKSGGYWCVDYTGASVPEGSSSSYNATFYTCN